MDWIPKYIKTQVNDRPRQRIDANYWNSLWNRVIEQGDHNAEGINRLMELFGDTTSNDIRGPFKEASYIYNSDEQAVGLNVLKDDGSTLVVPVVQVNDKQVGLTPEYLPSATSSVKGVVLLETSEITAAQSTKVPTSGVVHKFVKDYVDNNLPTDHVGLGLFSDVSEVDHWDDDVSSAIQFVMAEDSTEYNVPTLRRIDGRYTFKPEYLPIGTVVDSDYRALTSSEMEELLELDAVDLVNGYDLGTGFEIQDKKLNIARPVGSVYVTATNKNPGGVLGGTWELFDQELKELIVNAGSGSDLVPLYFTPSESVSSANVYLMVKGSQIRLRTMITLAVEASDTAVTLGTFNFPAMGVQTTFHSALHIPCGSDTGNAIALCSLDYNGAFTLVDVIGKDGGVMAAGSSFYFHHTFTIPSSEMIDESCDKFYWKRIA